MTRLNRRYLRVAVAMSAALLAVGCDRPVARVATPSVETPSRSSLSAAIPASELPRDSEAAARSPAVPYVPIASSEAIADTVITGRIRAAVFGDPAMAGADISVNTDHGVVVLAGSVKSHEQSGIASAHAQRQDGVMRVDNQLTPVAQ